ncbi:hypothetical protein AC482_06760 [miscellaneous Crenarchaeota group-15 archaeon DG-45]|uniref:4-hydroxy-tetrahydrodipicolinate synthase n=1 Tax=miscellaneous Crenarchaeota group-15 archaeon DG-45 TaxID=1685127 RepID=A0A0M0BLU5_9ARCH|nr:MAG: hypothetical protein AC482_06760 [miscellaneous Crenarchaeota group-15 archaeon DG-45]
MTEVFKGIYCVLLTAFKDDYSFDEERMRGHIDRVIEGGSDGVIPSGSTGQFAYLTGSEREKLITVTIDQVNGRVPTFAGTAAPSTAETIRWSKFAEDAGASAVMVVNPYYGHHADEALYQHFKSIAESVDLPVMLYNNTVTSGNDLKPELVARLAEVDNIDYIKECVSARRMQEIRLLCGDKMNLFSGVDDLLFECFTLGGVGAVSGGANAFPSQIKRLYALIWEKKDLEAAREYWYKLLPIALLSEEDSHWIYNLKEMCDIVGDPMGPRRPPLLPLPREKKEHLRKVVESFMAQIA